MWWSVTLTVLAVLRSESLLHSFLEKKTMTMAVACWQQ